MHLAWVVPPWGFVLSVWVVCGLFSDLDDASVSGTASGSLSTRNLALAADEEPPFDVIDRMLGKELRRPLSPITVLSLNVVAVEPPTAQQQQVRPQPGFVYRPGAAGFGYYANQAPRPPAVQAAPGAANRPRSVGPGARNWATGNRVPLHRPWLRPR